MFKNRFLLIIGVLSLLLVTMAVSRPLASAPKSADLSWPPRPVIIPVRGTTEFSDYYERHRDLSASVGIAFERTDDFYQRYPGAWVSRAAGTGIPVTGISAASDYFQRHPERSESTADIPLDECFDVSIGELAACRDTQTPILSPGLACESPVDCR